MNAALIFWPVLAQIALTLAVYIILARRKAAAVRAHAIDGVTPLALGLAWLYVALRLLHAGIHIGSNHVPHRMRVFVLSVAVLLALLATAGWQLASG